MKKKVISVILSTALMLSVFAALGGLTVSAEDLTSGDFMYSVNNDTVTITGYTGSAEVVEVPSEIDGKRVIQVGGFKNCTSLKSVIIPYGVEGYSGDAFSGCTSLTSLSTPDTIRRWGKEAFDDCPIKDLIMTDGSIEVSSVSYIIDDNIENITLPSSITKVGKFHTSYSSLKTINVSADNKNFSSQDGVLFNKDKTELLAYPPQKNGESYTVPNSVTSISKQAFYNCLSLNEINVSSENKYLISENGIVFNKNKTDLIRFPAGKTDTSYMIPNSVTSIGSSAFSGCSALENVTIPSSVTSIGSSAFSGCSALENVTIPSSVTKIDNGAFDSSRKLTIICYKDSAAHKFALNNSIACKLIDSSEPTESTTEKISVWNGEFTKIQTTKDATAYADITKNADGSVRVALPEELDEAGQKYFYGNTATTILKSNYYTYYIDTSKLDKEKIKAAGNKMKVDFTLNSCVNAKDLSQNGFGFLYSVGITGVPQSQSEESFDKKIGVGQTFTTEIDMTNCTYDEEYAGIRISNFMCQMYLTDVDVTISMYVETEFPTYDESKFNVTIGDYTAAREQIINVDINLNNNPGIWGFNFSIQYDPEVLTPITSPIDENLCAKIYASDIVDANMITSSAPKKVMSDNEYTGFNSLTFSFDNSTIENITTDGLLMRLRFKVNKNAAVGTTYLNYIYFAKDSFAGADGNAVAVTYKNGTVEVSENTLVYGDANGDGKVSLLDLLALRKHLAKWDIQIDLTAGDCNGDGKINLFDLILMRKYLAKWSVTLGPQI